MARFFPMPRPLTGRRVSAFIVIDTHIGPAAACPGDFILTDQAGNEHVVRQRDLAHLYIPADEEAMRLMGLLDVPEARQGDPTPRQTTQTAIVAGVPAGDGCKGNGAEGSPVFRSEGCGPITWGKSCTPDSAFGQASPRTGEGVEDEAAA